MEQHLRSAEAASSARSIINSIAHPPSTSTRLFHVNSNFTPKTPPLKLYISSHTSSTNHFKIYYYNTRYRLKLRHSPQIAANANSNSPPPTPPPASSVSSATERKLTIVACSAVTIALAIANRVLYKLALVPMKEYPFFLAQITTFGYVAIYFSVLYMRYRAGVATDEMLAFPKLPFIIIGLLEALGVVSGMYSGGEKVCLHCPKYYTPQPN